MDHPNGVVVAAIGDEGDYDEHDGDRDMILSKEDFEMLHALHRFVPLPALSSNILRILCDDDLQVAHEEEDSFTTRMHDQEEQEREGDNEPSSSSHTNKDLDKMEPSLPTSMKASTSGGTTSATAKGLPKHSPLTRRLSKHAIRKPHIEINLAASPQYKRKTPFANSNNHTSSSSFSLAAASVERELLRERTE